MQKKFSKPILNMEPRSKYIRTRYNHLKSKLSTKLNWLFITSAAFLSFEVDFSRILMSYRYLRLVLTYIINDHCKQLKLVEILDF